MTPLYAAEPGPWLQTYRRPTTQNCAGSLNGMTVSHSKKNHTESGSEMPVTSATSSTHIGLYERGLTLLASLTPRFNVTAYRQNQQLIALDTMSLEDFSACPLMRALASYQSVPLRSLLPILCQDYQMKTERYPAAELFTELMAADYRQESRSTLENLMLLGSGSDSMRETWPRMQLFVEIIDLLSPEQGDRATGNVLQELFTQAKKCPGSRSHQLVSSFLSAHGSAAQTENIELPKAKRGSTTWSAKAFFTGILSAFWTQYSTASAEGTHSAAQNTTRNCTVTEFPCANGLCIDRMKVCDSQYDCGLNDRSDELPELCPEHCEDTQRFLCKTISQCIPKSYHCDGDFDCRDGSDELSPPCPCPQHTVLCDDGKRCVDEDTLCNGDKDCDDGSDESFQHCENKFRDKISQWLEQSPANRHRLNKACCGKESSPMTIEDLYQHHGIVRKRCSEIAKYRRRDDCTYYTCRDRNAEAYWCKPYSYMNAGCIRTKHLCDGKHYCVGEQDEATDFCFLKCPDTKIACGNGACINPDQLCDGKQHCPNGRDEDPYTCLLENVRIHLKESCNFYQGNNKTHCRAEMRKNCCETPDGSSTTVTPAPMNASTVATSQSVFFHNASSNTSTNKLPAPQGNSSEIHPLSLGIGVIIGGVTTVLLGGIGRLCLNAYYRSNSSDDSGLSRTFCFHPY